MTITGIECKAMRSSNSGLSRRGLNGIGRWRWRGRSANNIGYAKARMLEWKMERFSCVEWGGTHHKHADNWTSTVRDLVNPRILTSAGGSSVTRKWVSYISAVLFRKQWRVPVTMTRRKKKSPTNESKNSWSLSNDGSASIFASVDFLSPKRQEQIIQHPPANQGQ